MVVGTDDAWNEETSNVFTVAHNNSEIVTDRN